MIVLLRPDADAAAAEGVAQALRRLGLDPVPLDDVRGRAFEVGGDPTGRVLELRRIPGVEEVLTRRTPLEGGEPLWPHFALRLASVALVLLAVLLLLSAFTPPALGDRAVPDDGASRAVEWYLRPLAGLLARFPGAGRPLVGLFWLLFFLWPFLDRADPATPGGRRLVLAMRVMGAALVVLLLVLALKAPA